LIWSNIEKGSGPGFCVEPYCQLGEYRWHAAVGLAVGFGTGPGVGREDGDVLGFGVGRRVGGAVGFGVGGADGFPVGAQRHVYEYSRVAST
jgi:hypothetical protein